MKMVLIVGSVLINIACNNQLVSNVLILYSIVMNVSAQVFAQNVVMDINY